MVSKIVLSLGVLISLSTRAEGIKSLESWLEPTSDKNLEKLLGLSPEESEEINARVRAFYDTPVDDPRVMNQRVPKYDVNRQRWSQSEGILTQNHHALAGGTAIEKSNTPNSLQVLAGFKASESFQRYRCQKIYSKHFPELYDSECRTNHSLVPRSNATDVRNHGRGLGISPFATVETNDKIELLSQGWVSPEELVFHLDYIPRTGETALPLWSDDYWRTKWGQTAYRYSERIFFSSYLEAIQRYTQPNEWFNLLSTGGGELSRAVLRWSPAEKYDLTVNDETFPLTEQQKKEGQSVVGADGDVESWMGLCHGWAAASIGVVPPKKAVTVVGARRVPVTWYPADVKAMATLAWANGSYTTNYVGGRCNSKSPETYANGRIQDQKCFDNNPATFHLALGNMVGRQKLSFVMDKIYDYEVWNQPIYSYQFLYFNPLNPEQRSERWQDVSVDYGADFRSRDRFQNPLTRGLHVQGGYDDSSVKKIVGVIASVTYLVESRPNHSPFPDQNSYQRETYTYDLELHEWRGNYYPMGGEWHQNSHPDFLWIHRRGTHAQSPYDKVSVSYSSDTVADAILTATAVKASRTGMPLCRVMKALVRISTGADTYHCP